MLVKILFSKRDALSAGYILDQTEDVAVGNDAISVKKKLTRVKSDKANRSET